MGFKIKEVIYRILDIAFLSPSAVNGTETANSAHK